MDTNLIGGDGDFLQAHSSNRSLSAVGCQCLSSGSRGRWISRRKCKASNSKEATGANLRANALGGENRTRSTERVLIDRYERHARESGYPKKTSQN